MRKLKHPTDVLSKTNEISLSQEITNIASALSQLSKGEETVTTERPQKRQCAAGKISIYNRAEYEAQESGRPAKPTTSYVFYGGIYNPGKMGSVAIYSRDPIAVYAVLQGRDFLFGHRIVSVSLERGMSTYVDVKFAA